MDRFTFVIMTARFDESLAFYRDLLEMSVLEEWVEFGHGAVLEATPRTVVELIDAPDSRPPSTEERIVFMGLAVSDVDAMHERVVTGGGKVNGSTNRETLGWARFHRFRPGRDAGEHLLGVLEHLTSASAAWTGWPLRSRIGGRG